MLIPPATIRTLALVQMDLDASGLSRYRMGLTISGDSEFACVWASLPDGSFSASSGNPIDLDSRDFAQTLSSVAYSVQDTLAEVELVLWPRCARHQGRLAQCSDYDRDWGVWWCHGVDPHPLAPIGQLRS
jgi:hypothetical protein